MRNLQSLPVSVGTVHHVLQLVTRQPDIVNHDQNLSDIRVRLRDEIFHDAMPVLAGVDANSTYC